MIWSKHKMPGCKKHLWICSGIFLLFLASPSFAQKGEIMGMITDKNTKEPLVGANIYIKHNMTVGTVSDLNGHYVLRCKPGHYTFVYSYTGKKTAEKEITVFADSTITVDVAMEIFSEQFKEVVIKAGKFDKKLEDQTVSMEVLKPRLIDSRNTTTIETALNMTPGLTILDEEPQIRGGSGFTFGVGSKVAVFIDNLPLMSGDNGKPDWSLIPIENIKQVEVVKGASSVLSGSAALSGAIYIRTAYPGLIPKTKVKVFTSMYDHPPAPASGWWSGINTGVGASFLHARKINDGYTDLVIGGFVLKEKNYIGAPKPGPLVIDTTGIEDKDMVNDKARFNFNFKHRARQVKGLSYGINGNFMYSKSSTALAWLDDTTHFYRAYPGAVLLGTHLTWYLDPFVSYYTGMGSKHTFTNRIFVSDNDLINDQSNKLFMLYNQYQYSKSFSNLGDLEFIGGAVSSFTSSNANMYAASGSPVNDLWNISLFMELEKKFGNALTLSGGTRIEHFVLNDTIMDTKPIFRFGANLKLGQETYLRMSMGQGYRFPTITERYIRTNVGSFGVFNNPALEPETSWNAEIGVKQGFKLSRFYGYLDGAYFYQEYNNTIEYLFGFWDPTYTFALAGFKFVNTGKSRITGVDLSLNGIAKINQNFNIYVLMGYTYMIPVTLQPDYVFAHDYNPGGSTGFSYNTTSVNPSGKILKYRFKHTAKIDLEFDYKKFGIGGSMKYFSKTENLDKAIFDFEDATKSAGGTLQPVLYRKYYNNHNQGNTILDARINCDIGEHHKVGFIVNNLLNRWYSLRPLKAEPMRKFMLQYRLEF